MKRLFLLREVKFSCFQMSYVDLNAEVNIPGFMAVHCSVKIIHDHFIRRFVRERSNEEIIQTSIYGLEIEIKYIEL